MHYTCVTLTLCSLADGSARRWQEGLQTGPPGKAFQGVCSRMNPHKQGFVHRIFCPPPNEDPDDHRSGTHSCLLCLYKSHCTQSCHIHLHLQQQQIEKLQTGWVSWKCAKSGHSFKSLISQNNSDWCDTNNWTLTTAALGSEVILETQRTTALIHSWCVDTLCWFFTDTGVHETFVNIWKRVKCDINSWKPDWKKIIKLDSLSNFEMWTYEYKYSVLRIWV